MFTLLFIIIIGFIIVAVLSVIGAVVIPFIGIILAIGLIITVICALFKLVFSIPALIIISILIICFCNRKKVK